MPAELALYRPQHYPTLNKDPSTYVYGELQKISRFSEQHVALTDANTASIAAHEAAWTDYTPTVTALAGTFTSASAVGRYKTIGKTVFVHVRITITTVGTGTYPVFTLPVTPLDFGHVNFVGRDSAGARTCNARHSFVDSTLVVTLYDNSNVAASGVSFDLTGVYEAA